MTRTQTSPLETRKAFGAAVRENRLRRGLSQEALAERAELHRTYITDVERGARNLSLESISKLAQALEIPVSVLFTRPGESPSAPGSATLSHPVRLLLIEDDQRDVELTLEAFGKAKLANHFEVVRDGSEALDFLFGRGDHAKPLPVLPALILLDLGLPKVQGVEVLRRIKAEERTRKIQVVVLTASRNDTFLQEALRLGADGFIVKPLDFRSFSAVTPQLNFYWALLGQRGKPPSPRTTE